MFCNFLKIFGVPGVDRIIILYFESGMYDLTDFKAHKKSTGGGNKTIRTPK